MHGIPTPQEFTLKELIRICWILDDEWSIIKNYALIGLTNENTTLAKEGCRLRCVAETWCRSINYYPNLARCELNTKAWGDDESAMNFVQINTTSVEYYYNCIHEPGTQQKKHVII